MKEESRETGFILVITLWTLTAVILMAGFFSLWVETALDRARQRQTDLQGELDIGSTRASLIYLLASRRMTLAGLTVPRPAVTGSDNGTDAGQNLLASVDPLDNMDLLVTPEGGEIALDDTAYPGLGIARFSIQDERGLLGINNPDPGRLGKLLGGLEVPGDQCGPLVDKLLDYTDSDNLVRLNGAEAEEYRARSLPPPPGRDLYTPWEARNVLDWGKFASLWKEYRLPRLTTVAVSGIPCPNTAPETVLKTLPWVDEETARRIIAARRIRPFMNLDELDQAAGKFLGLPPFEIVLLPSSHLRLTLWYEDARRMQEIHLQLTPQIDGKAPWVVNYELHLPVPWEKEPQLAPAIPASLLAAPVLPDAH